MECRKRLRLVGFDYSGFGPYFVTFCTLRRRCILSEIVDEAVFLTFGGRIVSDQISRLPSRLPVSIDAFVVMPNHVHAIVALNDRARQASPLRLSTVVGTVKSGSSREIGTRLWQRGYHDRVIRDEADLERVREYIATNPLRWALDPENPERAPTRTGRL